MDTKIKNKYRLVLIGIILNVLSIGLFSQSLDILQEFQNTEDFILYGFDKFQNIYNFKFNLKYNPKTEFGDLLINQNYKGNALTGNSQIFQDEQNLFTKYSYNLNDNFSILINQGWIFLSNSKSKDLNEFSRLNGLTGLKFKQNSSYVELLAGIEDNNQVGVKSLGNIYMMNAKLDNVEIDGYNIKATANSQILNLNSDRNQTELYSLNSISKDYSENDNFLLNVNYIYQDRLNLLAKSNVSDLERINISNFSIESRNKQKIDGSFVLELEPYKNVHSLFRLNYSEESTVLQYREYNELDSKTGVIRERQLSILGISGETRFLLENYVQTFGISVNLGNENNLISNKFGINNDDVFKIRNLYRMQDNNLTENKIFTTLNWTLSKKDTINLNFSTQLRQYNTPSKDDNTDMDEFRMYGILQYSRKINNFLNPGVLFEIQMNHQVYLKAQRSAGNNWLRIIKLSPYIFIQTKLLTYRPKFEVLANYTIYDFEDIAPGVKSFSYRQLSYSDSLNIKIHKNHFISSQLFFRYFEIGILFWNSFAESPQKSNTDVFCKLLWNYQKNENLNLFVGARFYNMIQSSLIKNAPPSSNYKQLSIAPEAIIKYSFQNNSSISVNGWYEFQYINEKNRIEFPNIFLTTNIKL